MFYLGWYKLEGRASSTPFLTQIISKLFKFNDRTNIINFETSLVADSNRHSRLA